MSNGQRTWLITGASSGFGRDLAEAVLETGDRVAATARKPEAVQDLTDKYPGKAIAVRLDVTDQASIAAALEQVKSEFGQLNVLVNNAGYGSIGALEEFSDEQIRAQMETNFFGAINITRAALPLMRDSGGGNILNVSSIGGLVSFPAFGIYCASKFALEAVSEALAGELAAQKIKVTIIEPGAFRTEFGGSRNDLAANRSPLYDRVSGKTSQWMKSIDGKQPGDPKKAAQAMIAVVNSANPPLRLLLGNDAWDAAHQKLDKLNKDFDAWQDTTQSQNFEGVTSGPIGG